MQDLGTEVEGVCGADKGFEAKFECTSTVMHREDHTFGDFASKRSIFTSLSFCAIHQMMTRELQNQPIRCL